MEDYPLELRHQDGHVTSVLYNASVYKDEDGTVKGVFAAARDITRQKKADLKVQQAQEELERSNKELEQFAYVASHDLQEPLRMVSSYTQLLAKRYKDKLDQDANEFIQYAVDGAERMRTLIDSLLAYSRVSKQATQLEPTDSKTVLDEALANLQGTIQESGVVVTAGELPTVKADKSQLGQLFQNLIGNAIKFCGAEPRIQISAEERTDDWLFSVRDNGIGIAPEQFERIFLVFQRLNTREEYAGTGIGLSVCKKIVERHGGKFWPESEPGKGTTFYFTLLK